MADQNNDVEPNFCNKKLLTCYAAAVWRLPLQSAALRRVPDACLLQLLRPVAAASGLPSAHSLLEPRLRGARSQ